MHHIVVFVPLVVNGMAVEGSEPTTFGRQISSLPGEGLLLPRKGFTCVNIREASAG